MFISTSQNVRDLQQHARKQFPGDHLLRQLRRVAMVVRSGSARTIRRMTTRSASARRAARSPPASAILATARSTQVAPYHERLEEPDVFPQHVLRALASRGGTGCGERTQVLGSVAVDVGTKRRPASSLRSCLKCELLTARPQPPRRTRRWRLAVARAVHCHQHDAKYLAFLRPWTESTG